MKCNCEVDDCGIDYCDKYIAMTMIVLKKIGTKFRAGLRQQKALQTITTVVPTGISMPGLIFETPKLIIKSSPFVSLVYRRAIPQISLGYIILTVIL